jgi:hypothetical protein
MSQATDDLETRVLTALSTGGTANFGNGLSGSAGSGVFIGLYTATPTDAGGGTELSGSGYARQQASFGSVTSGSITTNADTVFPDADASWGSITHAGLFNSATGGQLLAYGALNSPSQIDQGDIFKIPVGGFTISMD